MQFHVLGRILAAQALSSLGTSISTIALAFMVYELTGSMLHMGAVMAVSTFPLVLTSFVGGALLDRFSAKTVMVLADLGRGVLIFMLPFLAQREVGLIYAIAACMGILTSLFNPGQIKIVGELAEPSYLVRANSYLSVSRDGAELLGYLAGGVLVTYVGYLLTFVIDAGSYMLSAFLLLGLPRPQPRMGPAPRLATLIAETPSVIAQIWRRPLLRTNLLLAIFATMAVMMSVPNSYGLALEVFKRGAAGLAAVEVITSSGLIVGGIIISRCRLVGDKNRYVAYAIVGMGACFVAVGFSPWFWLSAGLLGLAGVVNVWMFVPSMTMFQQIPDDARKGRLITIRVGFGQIGATGGLLVGGVLGSMLGITRVFVVAGVAGVALALLIYLPHRAMVARGEERTRLGEVARSLDGAGLGEAVAGGAGAGLGQVVPGETGAGFAGAGLVDAGQAAGDGPAGDVVPAADGLVAGDGLTAGDGLVAGDGLIAGDGLDLGATGRTERGRRGIL